MKAKICLLLMVVLLVLPLIVACAKETPPTSDETKGELVIGLLGGFGGPMSGPDIEHKDGTLDAIRYINERMGGISGHSLDITVIDCHWDAALTIAGWERLQNEGVPVVISGQMGSLPLLPELAQKSHIPLATFTVNDIGQIFPTKPSYVFCQMMVMMLQIEAACDWIEKEWAKKGETRSPKIAFDLILMGTAPQKYGKAARMSTEKRGWEYMVTTTPLRPADVTTQVLQMKQFEADFVYLVITDAAMVACLKEFERQNFHPVVTGMGTMGSQEIPNVAGHLCEGAKFQLSSPVWTDTDEPIIDLLHELNAEWHPEIESHITTYTRGFAGLLVIGEALKRAVDSVGYGNLNSEAMKEAMETIRDYKPAGLRIGYTWTPTDHQGLNGIRWYEWSKELIPVPVTDWLTVPSLPPEHRIDAFWLQD